MASFDTAYRFTMEHEGGYVNDRHDVGGETYKGVARNYHPTWSGWIIIDQVKEQLGREFPSDNEISGPLSEISNLQGMIVAFYKERYWDVFWGDKSPSQAIAQEMLDTGINMGTGRAVKFLQQSLNLLNRNGISWDDLVEDGSYGPTTHGMFTVAAADDWDDILKLLNIFQGMHYVKYMRRSPTQERFARGWLRRVDFIKHPKRD